MTSATEELRRLLDERGVEWSERESAFRHQTFWKGVGSIPCSASERVEGGLLVLNMHVTPKEAVEVTLGRGTCRMTLRDDIHGHAYQDTYECSECGEQIVRETYMGTSEPPRFCPECGREVDE